ncbi:MAG TPA: hypothetical protein VF950_19870 [Planctomycetota bacterium]
MKRALFACLLAGCAGAPAASPGPTLGLSWDKNMLLITGAFPGGRIDVLYLEAYCRSGSTDREWKLTTIPHKTEKLSQSLTEVRLRCQVEGGVVVEHVIRAGAGEVDFEVVAVNTGAAYVDAVWVQPCVRVGDFTATGKDRTAYIPKSFIYVDGRRAWLPDLPWATKAIYTPGQVYVPAGVDRKDANPRPHSESVPSNGLIGCVSADRSMVFATAWEPYQELFQGVITCLHSDFRLGGLKPGETKKARGKIYVMPNDEAALLARYRRDFGG